MIANTHASDSDTAQIEAPALVHLSANGHRFSYQVLPGTHPETPPVFFINGAFQGMKSWERFSNHFHERGTTVILADLPGTGGADPLPGDVRFSFLADTVRQVLDHAGFDKVGMISASYGTMIAYAFALAYPERLEYLAMVGTMKEIPDTFRPGLFQTIKTLKAGRMEEFFDGIIGMADYGRDKGLLCLDPEKQIPKQRLVRRILSSQILNMSAKERANYEYNTTRLLNEDMDLRKPPPCRCLIFTGEYDVFTRPEFGREVASSLDDCIFTTVQNADHLFHLEQYPTTVELLHRFHLNQPLDHIRGINALERYRRVMSR